jgi:tRNA dimethylallyltransferase
MVAAAIAILGATGTGKSALAMRMARELPVELISVDSAQVYRGLDIGTAKPTLSERATVPHHLIDIRDPEDVYSAGQFHDDAHALISAIVGRGNVPVLVGGTMLYFRALFRGIAALPLADPEIRAALDARAAQEGWPALHAELAAVDPEAAARIHSHDAQRIQRALEVLAVSGRTLWEHWQGAAGHADHLSWAIGILDPGSREDLHARLALRLDTMIAAGFVDEVRQLLNRGTLDESSPVLRLVGYRQLAEYCRGQSTLEEATRKALYATRQLAKRQMTWLRSPGLTPPSATVLRSNAFSGPDTEQLIRSLIKRITSPC